MLCSAERKERFRFVRLFLSFLDVGLGKQVGALHGVPKFVCVCIPSCSLSGTDEFRWEQTSLRLALVLLSQDETREGWRGFSHDFVFGFGSKKCEGW